MAEDRFNDRLNSTIAAPREPDYLTQIAQSKGVDVTPPQVPVNLPTPQASTEAQVDSNLPTPPKKRWDEISQSLKYKEADPETRRAVRDAYFLKVLAPNFPPETHQAVWQKLVAASDPSITADKPESDSYGTIAGKHLIENVPERIDQLAAQQQRQAMELPERLQERVNDRPGLLEIPSMAYDVAKSLIVSAISGDLEADPKAKAIEYAAKDKELGQQIEANQPYVSPDDTFKGYASDAIRSVPEMAAGLIPSIVTGRALPGLLSADLIGEGDMYSRQRAAGQTPGESIAPAQLSGLAESVPELIPLGELLSKGSGFVRKIVGTAVGEGASEMITEGLNIGIEKGTITPDMGLNEAINRIVEAGIVGTIAGAPFGVIGAGKDAVTGKKDDRDDLTPEDVDTTALESAGFESIPPIGSSEPTPPLPPVIQSGAPQVSLPQLTANGAAAYPAELQEAPQSSPLQITIPGQQASVDLRKVDLTRAEQQQEGYDAFSDVVNSDKPVADIVKEQDLREQGFQEVKADESGKVLYNEATGEVDTVGSISPAAAKAPITAETPAQQAAVTQQVARRETNITPTDAQKASGRYKKGQMEVHGLKVSIENPAGSERSGKDSDGETWSVTMPVDYGYINRTEGADGDPVDVFIGNKPTSNQVFVIDQMDIQSGKFDETKVMMGFDTLEEAKQAYVASFSDGKGEQRIGDMGITTSEGFKDWLKTSNTAKPYSQNVAAMSQLRPLEKVQAMPKRQRQTYLKSLATKIPASMNQNPSYQEYIRQVQAMDQAPVTSPQAAASRKKKAYVSKAKPLTLLQFISRNGGVYDRGGELKAMNLDRWHLNKPGYKKIIAEGENGNSLDDMALMAWENGYFPEFQERPSMDDLLSAISREYAENKPRLPGGQVAIEAPSEESIDDENLQWLETKAAEYGIETEGKDIGEIHSEILMYIENLEREQPDDIGAEAYYDVTEFLDGFVSGELDSNLPEWVTIDIPEAAYEGYAETEGRAPEAQEQPVRAGEDAQQGAVARQESQAGDGNQDAAVAAQNVPAQTKPVTERTEAGEQVVLQGAERISDKNLAERKMQGGLKAKKPQKDVGTDGGLFDTGARSQTDIFDTPAISKTETTTPVAEIPAAPDTGEIRPEILANDAYAALRRLNLTELNQLAFELGVALTPELRASRPMLLAEIETFKAPAVREAGKAVAQRESAAAQETAPPRTESEPRAAITQNPAPKTPITETIAPQAQTGAYTLQDHEASIKRLHAGDMTAEEALSLAKRMIGNKADIVAALEKMTIQQLQRKFGTPTYRQEKKASVVKSAWQNAISEYFMGGSFTWSPFEQSYENAIIKQIEGQTDATIKEGIERMNQRTQQVKERVEGYKDPKTLEDFRTKVRVDGIDSLSNEQLARYDELVAEAKLEIMAKDDEQRRTVQGVKAQENTSTSDIIETKHTQKGTDLFVVKLEERVEKETYNILNSTAKRLGGYYSSYTKGGAVAGFQFPTRDAAEKFKAAAAGEAVVREVSRTPEDRAAKLDAAGDRLIEKGTEKMDADRKVNTARRAAQAASSEADAAAMIARGKLMKNLAERIREGKAGMLGRVVAQTELDTLNSAMRRAKYHSLQKKKDLSYDERRKLEAEPFNNEDARMVEYPFPQFHRENIQSIAAELDKKPGFKMLARHLLSEAKSQKDGLIRITKSDYLEKIREAADRFDGLLGWVAEDGIQDYMRLQRLGITNVNLLRNAVRDYSSLIQAAPATNAVKAAERQLAGKKFEGYFPTPKEVSARMAEWLGLKAEHRVLEPSAGKGNLIEAAIDAGADVKNIDAFEVVGDLRSILELKGYNLAGRDFTELESDPVYDRIIMNPPFENGQDIDHVRKAYDLLKPGGSMVAIMGEGAFFRSDKKATEFRQWLEDNDGWSEKLPEGTFKESGTGVNTRMVFLEKSESATRFQTAGENIPPSQKVRFVRLKTWTDNQNKVSRKLKQYARETFGEGLNFKFVDRIYAGNTEVNGVYGESVPEGATNLEGFVAIALNEAKKNDKIGTLNHEGIHFLRAMGALDNVWGQLRRQAEDKWISQYNIRNLYPKDGMDSSKYQELLVEEAIAEAFATYVGNPNSVVGPIAGAFKKIAAFFDKLRNYLRGQGFQSWRDVFNDIAAGEYATSQSIPSRARGQMMASRGVSGNPFYSQVATAVQGLSMKTAPASQWINTIKNAAGVKQEELDWIGLEEWMSAKDGKVSKEEILAYIDSTQVSLSEVVLDDSASKTNQDKVAAQIKASYDIVIDSDTSAKELRDRGVSEPMIDRWYNAFMRPDNLTKYSKYQLPGGENYREMLITLPDPKEGLAAEVQKLNEQMAEANSREDYAEYERLYNLRQKKTEEYLNRETYKSSHWEQANVLTHVRMADHTDAAGRKILMLEEVQSDWHQTGRKKGYTQKVTKITEDDGTVFWTARDMSGEIFMEEIRASNESDARAYIERQLARSGDTVPEYTVIEDEPILNIEGVPNAPFKKTWHELAMKRMLRYAADNGYDAIAWTTGDQQAERYDLSKQISRVTFHDNTSGGIGKPNMEGEPVEGMLNAYDMDGKRVVNRFVQVKDIPDYIGKDAADRLFQTQPKAAESAGMGVRQWELSGQELKVGGEGMIGFYDKMLPAFVSKYTKKWGGKVSKANIGKNRDFSKLKPDDLSDSELLFALQGDDFKKEEFTVWTVDITPQMKESVQQGQPMFQRPQSSKTNQLAQEAAARGKDGMNDLSRWTKRNFTKEGFLGEDVFNLKIESDGIKNADEFDLAAMVSDMESDIKKVYGKDYSKLTKDELKALRDYLAGASTVTGAGDLTTSASARSVPEAIKPRLAHMRAYLDRASARMQDAMAEIVQIRMAELNGKQREEAEIYLTTNGQEGKLPASILNLLNMIQTIETNKGVYLNRSYQAFDDPKWKDTAMKDTALMEKARAWFRNEYEGLTEDEVDGAILSVLEDAHKKGNFVSFMAGGSKVGSKDVSFLKRRKDVPEVIRELLGEYTDPKVNFVRSASKMSNYLAGHYFLMGVRRRGLGEFIFSKPTGEFHSRISATGNEALSPLDGLYTHPDFIRGLEDAGSITSGSEPAWLEALYAVNSAVKYGKTVIAPTTQSRNFISNTILSLANGHLNWMYGVKHIKKRLQGDAEYREYLSSLIRLGVLHDNPYSSELKIAIQQVDKTGMLPSQKMFRKGLDLAQKAYQGSDDFWKIIGFENEKARLLRRKGMTQQNATRLAAKRIRDGYPTYSMVPRAIRAIRKFPVTGTFVSFPWEMMRTTRNLVRIIAEDARSGNMEGVAARTIGFVAAAAFADVVREVTMMLAGVDDDDDKAVRDLAAPWQSNTALAYLGMDENGQLRYIDLSFMDPYSYIKKPLYAAIRGVEEDFIDNMTNGAWEILSPFFGQDITIQAIGEVVYNKREGGGEVYNPRESRLEKTKQIANHLRKALAPGIALNMERTTFGVLNDLGVTDEGSPGKKYNTVDEALAWIGWRSSTLNIPSTMVYSTYDFVDDKRFVAKILSREMVKSGTPDKEDIRNGYNRMMAARRAVYSKILRQISAAQRLGIDDKELYTALTVAGVGSSEAAFMVKKGQIPPFVLSREFAETAKARAIISTPEKDKKPLISEEINRRRSLLMQVIREGEDQ